MRRTKPPVGWEHVKNCFPVPNELLEFDLPAGTVAVYIYLLRHATAGPVSVIPALLPSQRSCTSVVIPLPSMSVCWRSVANRHGEHGNHHQEWYQENGNLLYTLVPMHEITQTYYDRQFEKAELAAAQQKAMAKAERLVSSSSRLQMGRAHRPMSPLRAAGRRLGASSIHAPGGRIRSCTQLSCDAEISLRGKIAFRL